MTPTVTKIVLASGSPRRRKLLKEAGVSFTVVVPRISESWPDDDPAQAVALAVRKARAVAKTLGTREIVLAADTIVRLRGKVFGKPADEREARAMLTALSGVEHTVTTGVAAMIAPAGDAHTIRVDSRVWLRPLIAAEIEAYVATGSSLDKAGAYAVQDEEWKLVQRVEGSLSNVIGLPMSETLELLAGVL